MEKEKILKISFKNNVIIHVFDLYEMVAAAKTYDLYAPYPVLSIVGKNNKFSRSAKQLDLTKIRVKNNLCEAIVVKTKAEKFLLNLYYKFYQMPYPVKGFYNEEEAKSWINEVVFKKSTS
ncbi:MAG: hypothetical protein Kow0079_12070 [Vicingaceae bacterium]